MFRSIFTSDSVWLPCRDPVGGSRAWEPISFKLAVGLVRLWRWGVWWGVWGVWWGVWLSEEVCADNKLCVGDEGLVARCGEPPLSKSWAPPSGERHELRAL